MKKLLVIIVAFWALIACEQQEVLEAAPDPSVQAMAKSGSNEYAENADFSYPIESEEDFEAVLNTMAADDVVVIVEGTAHVFEGLAPLWMDPDTLEGREICKGLGGIPFIKCVVRHVKAGEKVMVWMDDDGTFHASTST